jgi:predicted dehydrogenase
MLDFGLFGTGHWAEVTHAAAIAAHPDTRLVGVWGRDPGKAAALAARHDVPAFTDVDALIGACDAVAVALPPDVQADIAVRAATASRHLLLDKPLALTVADADRVVAAAGASGVASVVFFTNRFRPEVAAHLASAAATGGWHGARVTMFGSIFASGGPYADSPWRRTHGGLWDVGPHALSVVVPVLGPVTEVAAMGGPADETHLLLRHAGGAVSTVAVAVDAPPAAVSFDVVLYGEDGVVPVPRGAGTAVDALGLALDQLVDSVRTGVRDQRCDVRFGRDVVAVLAAAETARAQGRTVRLPG